jgi:predicted kinase
VEYSTEQDDFCLSVMLQVAGYLWRRDPDRRVILDGRPFALRYQRADVTAHAARHGVPFRLILCVCSDRTARLRLEQDIAHPARNRDFALYRALKAAFEPIEGPHLRVDTDQSIEACFDQCRAYIADGASA